MTNNINHSDILLKRKFGIVGSSESIKKAKKLLLKAAPTELSVLITGETGTGKEVFSRAIHGLSKRKGFSYITVNCGAIPETLLEAELFGHAKGAYTGAGEARKGFFEAADKGTIFLDEIGEMPIETQVKLLRVLESGEFSRLGSSESTKVDVRVVAATNRDLEIDVKNGKFRQDLFYRLRSVHIVLPPLREHPEDIPELAEYFLNQFEKESGIRFEGISESALRLLVNHRWDGNIRELKNLLESIISLEASGYIEEDSVIKYLRPALPQYDNKSNTHSALIPLKNNDDLPDNELGIIFRTLLEIKNDIANLRHLTSLNTQKIDQILNNQNDILMQTAEEIYDYEEPIDSLGTMKIDQIEKKLIIYALKRFDGSRRLAAKELGISERTLYRKLKLYNIE